ncbi:LRRIQ4 [Branchiostoma lanceolatum]|uniref:Leucine-rich repeat protein SHOC-2 n=1 Tax=Branchiostoma lanceolatum TaxID=7740 RepID=A0A8J9ZY07_BRALA|nr:LRRIQ4 [Branchiostoma lanceolatum]
MARALKLKPQTVDGQLVLDLSNKSLMSIPEEVFDITELECLILSDNSLTSIPEAIGRLQKLRRLDADRNMLTSLPRRLCSLTDLDVLFVNDNNISSLPPGVEKMQKLSKLGLGDNKLTQLPPGVCSLPRLRVLHVGNNMLSSLPPGVEKLQSLAKLKIKGNQLTEVPPGVCSLSNLEVFDVGNNKLSALPPTIEEMQKLSQLSINDNELTELTGGVCSLLNLEVLDVRNNKLSFLPSDIARMRKLTALYLSHNKLTELPSGVCSLSNLEVLLVAKNRLYTLPPGIEMMQKLTRLGLSHNQLTEVPQAVCSLSNLEKVDLRKNKITRLPIDLHRADKLSHLDTSENPLTYPPPDVCEQGTQAILTFLKQAAEKDEEELQQAFNRWSLRVQPTQWKPIARRLGLTSQDIEDIEARYPDDQMYQALMRWKQRDGPAASMSALEEHLIYLDLQELVDHLMRISMSAGSMAGENNSSFDQKSPKPVARVKPMDRSDVATAEQQKAVFLSYNWDHQNKVLLLRKRLEERGYSCWLDKDQVGPGGHLLKKMDDGIREAKVVVSCVTPPYVESKNCQDEVVLAHTLQRHIIPVILEELQTTWPPPGPMSIPFAQLLYIDMTKCQDDDPWRGEKFEELVKYIDKYVVPDAKVE